MHAGLVSHNPMPHTQTKKHAQIKGHTDTLIVTV